MTYKQLQDDVIERCNGDSSQASSALRTRIKRFLNAWYRRILAMPAMSKVRDIPTTITTAAGTAEYTLAATTIRSIYDAMNQYELVERSLGWLRERDAGQTASGNPIAYVIKERTRATIDIILWPTPPAIATLKVDAEGVVTELAADGDFPILPEDYHYMLADGALYNEYLRMGDVNRATLARKDIDIATRDLRVFLNSSTGLRLVPGRAARLGSGRSRLGPYFPSDSW